MFNNTGWASQIWNLKWSKIWNFLSTDDARGSGSKEVLTEASRILGFRIRDVQLVSIMQIFQNSKKSKLWNTSDPKHFMWHTRPVLIVIDECLLRYHAKCFTCICIFYLYHKLWGKDFYHLLFGDEETEA